MKCEQVSELLSAYIDGMTSDKETKALEAHLARCANCRRELDDYRLLRGIMREMETPLPPENFSSVVQKSLQENKNKIFSATTIERPKKGGWVAAVLAGLALASGIYASSYLSVGDFFVGWQDKKEDRKPRVAIEDILERFQQWKQEEGNVGQEIAEPTAVVDSNSRVKAGTGGEKKSGQEPKIEDNIDYNYTGQIMAKELPAVLAQVMELADGRGIRYSVLPGSYGNSEARRIMLELEPSETPELLAELEALGIEFAVEDPPTGGEQDKELSRTVEEDKSPLAGKSEAGTGAGNLAILAEPNNNNSEETLEGNRDKTTGEDGLVKRKTNSAPDGIIPAETKGRMNSEDGGENKDEKKVEGTKVNLNILIIQQK